MRNKIKTDRLVLRRFAVSDCEALVKFAGHFDVARATAALPHPYTDTDANTWIEITKDKSGTDHIYAIANMENECIGCVSLLPRQSHWELGYWLGKPYWKKGYMREAVAALLAEARQELALTAIHACVFIDNPRSFALLLSFGFKLTERASEFCVARGETVETNQLTLSYEKEPNYA